MDIEKLKRQIGINISSQRKRAKLTQAGLAEKLNYSDKAVSKWERGESVPDVLTLVQLAEQFDITVNELVSDPNALPDGTPNKLEKAMTQVSEKALKRKANKNVIQALSSTLVWFVALFIFVVISSFSTEEGERGVPTAVGLTAMCLLSRAAELGLASCMLGYFDEEELRAACDIPGDKVRLVIALGYAAAEDPLRQKDRRPMEESVTWRTE